MPSNPATRRASAASRTEQQPCLFFPLLLPPAGGDRLSGPPGGFVSQCSPPCTGPSTPLGEPSRRNAPITSYPWRSSSAAATELSTPPLMARSTFFRGVGTARDSRRSGRYRRNSPHGPAALRGRPAAGNKWGAHCRVRRDSIGYSPTRDGG